MNTILWIIVILLLLGWGGGVGFHLGGSLIHLILVIAVILVVYNLITGRRVV